MMDICEYSHLELSMAALEQYKWMPITCFVVAFFTAFGMGTLLSCGVSVF